METIPMSDEPKPGRPVDRVGRMADRKRRRRLAAALAAAGIAAITFAVAGPFGSDSAPASSNTEGSPATGGAQGPGTGTGTAKPPSTAPGGVGVDPEKTGLPAIPAEGGLVRSGTKEEGCFADVRSYLEQWHKTGVEPDPCFLSQPASDQSQPSGVQRTYNGERF